MHKKSKVRMTDTDKPLLRRHARTNIQDVLRDMEPFVSEKEISAARMEYVSLLQAESLLRDRYPKLYQDALMSGIIDTQRNSRNVETVHNSWLRDVLMKATKETSIGRYTSGTALYEYNSLKKSERILMKVQSRVEYNPTIQPKRMTTMTFTPRTKSLTNSKAHDPSISSTRTSMDEMEGVLRTVEYQQSKIEQLKQRLNQAEADEDIDSHSIQLSNRLRAVYREEWHAAYQEMNKWFKNKEPEIIYNLFRIVRFAYEFCGNAARKQIVDLAQSSTKPLIQPIQLPYVESPLTSEQRALLSSTGMKYAKRYRKEVASVSTPQLCRKFKEKVIASDFGWDPDRLPKCISSYIDKTLEVIWMMCVQDPPMALTWPSEGSLIDIDRYTLYNNDGKRVQQCVWPCVLVTSKGPVVAKGIVVGCRD